MSLGILSRDRMLAGAIFIGYFYIASDSVVGAIFCASL